MCLLFCAESMFCDFWETQVLLNFSDWAEEASADICETKHSVQSFVDRMDILPDFLHVCKIGPEWPASCVDM